MRIAVSGASGLIGAELLPFLTAGGHEGAALVRPGLSGTGIAWDPARGPEPAELAGFDAVVHLAGENIGAGRWTADRKQRIRTSRVDATRRLAEAIAAAENGPHTMVCASAVGWYGDRGDELLSEESAHGEGFLAELCRDWEAAAGPAREAGARVVHLRFGVVLSPRGGALSRMLTPFRLGLGGRIGSGKQYMPWLSIEDAIGTIHHALTTESLAGAVNAVAPQPVTNHQFTKALGSVLRRSTVVPLPAFAVGLLFGEMGRELLLGGQRVEPARLLASGYAFRDPEIRGALASVLGR